MGVVVFIFKSTTSKIAIFKLESAGFFPCIDVNHGSYRERDLISLFIGV